MLLRALMLLGVVTGSLSIASAEAQTQTGSAAGSVAEAVTVTILSSNLASGATVGEWGLSALVTVDGRCILFDAGRHPDTVLRNADVLQADLSCVTDVVLSHFHFDHTTGLPPIIDAVRTQNPGAIRRVHVAQGFFLSRRVAGATDTERNQMIAMRETLAAVDVAFVVHGRPTEILPGVWVSGPIDRRHPERNYSTTTEVRLDGAWVEDHVPESQALTIVTREGHIVLLGCGHSGVVNALDQVQTAIADLPIHALMGGLHLFGASDEILGWTADRLRSIGVEHLMAGHCTGIEPLIRLRAGLNLTRRTAVVGAVGSQFVYGEGIRPTRIAM
ncbi:MAG: MBL fold metallo-hydrolase [Acidobacteriota bacterium]|nr:MBL fold metallo-hydrolase [Acidobacteriota bacterium]